MLDQIDRGEITINATDVDNNHSKEQNENTPQKNNEQIEGNNGVPRVLHANKHKTVNENTFHLFSLSLVGKTSENILLYIGVNQRHTTGGNCFMYFLWITMLQLTMW